MPGTNLTRVEAEARASAVSDVTYEVTLDLTTSERTFSTTSTIRFASPTPGVATFVDFIGESVEAVTLNGAALDPAEVFADSRVSLPELAAENVVTIEATGVYTNTGEGLHRFVDPVDDEVYLYTQFEVPDSRRMYPVFEQPDLKATYAFTVTAPAHWQIVSNSPTPEPEPAGDGVATWRFRPTERMSSYITALIAGPYDVVEDSVASRAGEIPLRILCRRSLTQYLDADNLFALTKTGFAFFENEFDRPFPFSKYDQIFTPEYNAGAMENAGAVTFNEVYVFRSKVTEAIRERRGLTLLHELAHMWFGNLVTMRWWDDLWLNESFAEWASTTCQAEATEWTEAWTTFGTFEKDWAYRQDQLSSTHPIVAPIRDLRDVEVNFDGITYAKGASVLKQLVAYVGREPFTAGLRSYFAAHAWGNTTLADLLTELEATSGRDLRAWSAAWLETAGVNTLRPVLEADADGTITSAVIEQTYAAGYETLRPHRLAVGLYAVDGDRLVRTDRLELDVAGERTEVPELVGRATPDLLLVNDDDLTYAKIRLDERSLATALAHPRGFDGSLPRSLVLASAWDMTRDAEMARPRLRRPRPRLAPRRGGLDAAAHPHRPAPHLGLLLHRARAPRGHPGPHPGAPVGAGQVGQPRQRRPAPARHRGGRHDRAGRRHGIPRRPPRRQRDPRRSRRRHRHALDPPHRPRRGRRRRRGGHRRRAGAGPDRDGARARRPGPGLDADGRHEGGGLARGRRQGRPAQLGRRRRGPRLRTDRHERCPRAVRRALPRHARPGGGEEVARDHRGDRHRLLPPGARRRGSSSTRPRAGSTPTPTPSRPSSASSPRTGTAWPAPSRRRSATRGAEFPREHRNPHET